VKTELRLGVDHAAGRRGLHGTDDAAPGTHTLVVPTLDLTDIERQVIDHALTLSGGNRTRAAALLGIDVRTLRRKLNGPSRSGAAIRVADPTTTSDPPGAEEPLKAPSWPLDQADKVPQGK
jgi:hypothetical protein